LIEVEVGLSRDHRRLKAFQLADSLVLEVYRATEIFPKTEIYGLRAQIRRAAASVPLNIVEGAARKGETEFVHFLRQAFGSLREVGYAMDLSVRLGFLEERRCEQFFEMYNETSRVLSGLIASFEREK